MKNNPPLEGKNKTTDKWKGEINRRGIDFVHKLVKENIQLKNTIKALALSIFLTGLMFAVLLLLEYSLRCSIVGC